ncbi:hypothetical protein EJB00_04490 [Wolbachia endosymbiont of Drosophila mauritiana]|uniref:hypothetical protein n=1 Tax=unclassified Wolbachia TaxID=2640676 RepID=UPI00107EA49F|nr:MULTISPECIES: hypothetical protein [unclassified Wolbachia]QCB62820.1 hypothetical protein EJA99_04505 [Wolbachia endosymbiont of Drosophila mauritiana]QCB63865.1 hypothetical protein EJB00_04490 [Wolbachia endosymbiont of Drosophila mauritiana]QWE33875.1 Uncharacterized protein WwMa_09980 [Wolbachia endosymbiont of Drosophila simulans]TGB07049.1 hypothetical protein E5C28_02115 [Wolbachia endosymbiont of Drosophila mauritiana]
MNDLFKSDNYDKNLNSLIRVIKLKDTKKINEQYDETLKDLSQALKNFTNNAKDVAKFVIYSDLNNYIEPLSTKPLGFIGTLKEILDRVLGKDIPTNDNDIKNFVGDELSGFTIEKAAEYTNILSTINLFKKGLKEILDSKQSGKGNKEHKSYEVSTENKTTSKQKEDTPKLQEGKQPVGKLVMKRIKRPTTAPPPPPTASKKVHFKPEIENVSPEDSGYESSLSEESGHEEISNYQEKSSKSSTKDPEDSKLAKKEPTHKTKPKKNAGTRKGYKKRQAPEPPALNATNQEIRQETKEDKSEILSNPKRLDIVDQQVSTKPIIVEVTSQKSAESKPILKKSADKAASEVKAVIIKEKVNSKKDGRVKSIVGKFEQNQVAKSKATPATQADIGMKKDPAPSQKTASQSQSFPAGNKRSKMNPITAKSDPKPSVNTKPILTHVSVKKIAARFESHGKK